MGKLVGDDTFPIERDFGEPFGLYQLELKSYWAGEDEEYIANKQVKLSLKIVNRTPEVEDIAIRVGEIHIAERIIKKWNVTDNEDRLLMITPQNIGRLPLKVLDWILAE